MDRPSAHQPGDPGEHALRQVLRQLLQRPSPRLGPLFLQDVRIEIAQLVPTELEFFDVATVRAALEVPAPASGQRELLDVGAIGIDVQDLGAHPHDVPATLEPPRDLLAVSIPRLARITTDVVGRQLDVRHFDQRTQIGTHPVQHPADLTDAQGTRPCAGIARLPPHIFLGRFDRPTDFTYEFSIGLSFEFGSIFNNVVNNRF